MGHFVELVLEFLFSLAKDSPDKMPYDNISSLFVFDRVYTCPFCLAQERYSHPHLQATHLPSPPSAFLRQAYACPFFV